MRITRVSNLLCSLAAAAVLFVPGSSAAAEESPKAMTPDDYRVFCGFMDAIEKPKLAKLSDKKRDRKIAKMARLSVKKLRASVAKAKEHGQTCDEVGKVFESQAKTAVDGALGKRVDMFIFDVSDPSHVVAQVRWLAGDRKKLVQEAVLLAKVIGDASPLVKTIALRAVNPSAPDRDSDSAAWLEATMTASRTKNIVKDKIKDSADIRYARLLDGVKCAPSISAETQLGYRRGPCEGKPGIVAPKEDPGASAEKTK